MRSTLIMASFLSIISHLFGTAPAKEYKTADIYTRLRTQILHLKAESIGATQNEKVLAVLMETGYPEAVVTLVSVGDGTASLYFSNGGGLIGCGEYEKPNAASKKFCLSSELYLKDMTKTDKTPLPKKGFVRFYVITREGVFTIEAKENDLGNNKHTLSPLFYVGQDLITEMRIVDEQRQKGKAIQDKGSKGDNPTDGSRSH